MCYYIDKKKYFECEVFNVLEGLDFGSIIVTLDYYIRKIMALLDDLLLMFGGSSATPEEGTDATDTIV